MCKIKDELIRAEEEREDYSIEEIPQFAGTMDQLNKLTIIKK